MNSQNFSYRHIGPNEDDIKKMLAVIGVSSMNELINKTIPESIRLDKPLEPDKPLTEYEYLKHISKTCGTKQNI